MLFPPGHYHSPIPDVDEIRPQQDAIFHKRPQLPGIDLREDAQLALIPVLAELIKDHPFREAPYDAIRYGFDNAYFSYGDGLVLYGMLRLLKPSRYIEIGSGWSSALVLDTIDLHLAGQTHCTFIEPIPDRLDLLLTDADRERVEIHEMGLGEVDPSLFTELEPGDVLFIDSTHVSRAGSDVNQLFFEILPILPAGVHVHIHDIFYPFEYRMDWIELGISWQEAYLLRAYLIGNTSVQLTWFNHYLQQLHHDAVAAQIPQWALNPGGSVWLETR